jgi:hypothetical protein
MVQCLPHAKDCSEAAGILFLLIILAVVSHINFIRLIAHQIHVQLERRIVVLNCRMGMLMAAYSTIAIFIYIAPQAAPVLEAAEAVTEGFAVYCFFKIIMFSSQGKEHILKTIRDSEYTRPCCHYFQKVSTACCFKTMYFWLWQFFIIRPILVLTAGIIELKVGEVPAYTILTVLAILSLVGAMVALIRIYQTLGGLVPHLYMERKILFVKLIILLLVIENRVLTGNFSGAS